MNSPKKIIKSSNHRFMSLFFFIGSLLAFFQMKTTVPFLLKIFIVGSCAGVGLYFLLKKSKDMIWIQNNLLCFSKSRGKKVQEYSVEIKQIEKIILKFSGSRSVKVFNTCFLKLSGEKNLIQLPDGIEYSAYNPLYVKLEYLMKPLSQFNSSISIEIVDEVKGVRIDFD